MIEVNNAPHGLSPLLDHISYTPEESARVTGRSRTRIFKAIREGCRNGPLPFVKADPENPEVVGSLSPAEPCRPNTLA
jgi:hypothetical protein